MSLKLFFTDYNEDNHIRSDEAKPANLAQIIECLKIRLKDEDNFVGLIDGNDVMLQFMVEEGGQLSVDVPINDRKGSFTKAADLKGCIEIVESLGRTIAVDNIDGLEFKAWGR